MRSVKVWQPLSIASRFSRVRPFSPMSNSVDKSSEATRPEDSSGQERLLLGVFFFSGFLALVYEICWIRKASLVFGAESFALSCVLAVFFGGLALGSYLFGRVSVRQRRPLRLYGILELVIAVFVLLSPAFFALANKAYGAVYEPLSERFALLTAVRCLLLTAVMLPPTVAMGGTFPLMCRWFVNSRERVSGTVGGLFAINTLGACLGAAACGLFLVPKIGVSKTIYIGACLSALMGFGVLRIPLAGKELSPAEDEEGEQTNVRSKKSRSASETAEDRRGVAFVIGALFFASGFIALGNEILWSRFLSLILLRSVYTYTLVLTVILLGLVLGAAGTARYFDRSKRRALWFGGLQMGIGLSVLLVLLSPADFWLGWIDAAGIAEQAALVMLVLLLPACLSGAAFPLAMRLAVEDPRLAGADIGRMTALNTVGGILGSLVFGFLLLPGLGMKATVLISTGLSVSAGCLAILLLERSTPRGRRFGMAVTGVALWLGLVGGLKTRLPDDYLAGKGTLLDFREGVNAFVSVVDSGHGERQLKIDRLWQGYDGKGHQVMAAHIPMALHPDPKEVVAIGMGAGMTPSRFVMYDIDRLDCVEIEGETLDMIREHFDSAWMEDPRVNFIVDDGRNYLAHTRRTYDLISIEVGQTYRPGVASFYTREFYAAASKRLNSGGLLCQFLPIAFFSLEEIEILTATFLAEFPQSVLWYNTSELLLIGRRDQPVRVMESGSTRIGSKPEVLRDLEFSYWGGVNHFLVHPHVFLGGFLLGPDGLAKLAGNAVIYSDERPWLEYSSVLDRNSKAAFVQRVRPLLDPLESVMELKLGDHAIAASADVRDKNLRDMVAMSIEDDISWALLSEDRAAAIQLLREAVNWNPDNIHLQMLLADELCGMDRHAEAIPIYRRVIAAKPGYAEAHSNLGGALASQGKLTQAIACFREALKRDPGLDQTRADLNRAVELRGRVGPTLEELEATVRENPHNTSAMLDLAQAYFDKERYPESIAQYRKLLVVDPEAPTPLNDLAWALATVPEDQGRNPREALQLAERATLMTGRDRAIPVATMAAAHAALGNFWEAQALTREAIGLARKEGDLEVERRLRERLTLFEAGRAIFR